MCDAVLIYIDAVDFVLDYADTSVFLWLGKIWIDLDCFWFTIFITLYMFYYYYYDGQYYMFYIDRHQTYADYDWLCCLLFHINYLCVQCKIQIY